MRQQYMNRATQLERAETLVDSQPVPDYGRNYQVAYPDRTALVGAAAELITTAGVTTPLQIEAASKTVAAVAAGNDGQMLVVSGGCRERIQLDTPITRLAHQSLIDVAIVEEVGGGKLVATKRDRGQYKKPRSNGVQKLASGVVLPAYVGDIANDEAETIEARTPDPSRLVAGAVQARDLEATMTAMAGRHIPAFHEMLHLLYEQAFVRRDPASGRLYLTSADVPWVGDRTKHPDSEQMQLMRKLANTGAVKLSATSSVDDIARTHDILNPHDQVGKEIYMLRLKPENADQYPRILGAISKHAPKGLVMFDVHGMTTQLENGAKIRHVGTLINGMNVMRRACITAGVYFGGVHVETTHDDNRLECTDEIGQEPTHDGGIDPQLNPRQFRQFLEALMEAPR